ncbi:diguanylate cyclase domain-containing protein [Bacillus taeanensis]|uniref:GGDEF domain-containing protein n=1 Tax=Bacillus taeanensis TaxID=273032 RepID=A0A366Y172_9BACI|nr:GGDEF domain-containing protein [Bacillus taeanensis]RBW70163.1 hypothetical protein DS031_08215 [Bacillus taeanensis]
MIYYHFLNDVPLRMGEIIISILLLFPAWWAGKQYDKAEFYFEESKKRKADLNYMAYYDRLTGLPNRYLAEDYLKEALNYEEKNKTVAVMLIGLDRFKMVNDSRGHRYGDFLLKQVSERIQHCRRDSQFTARYGGDKFVVVIKNKRRKEIEKAAEAFIKTCAHPFLINKESFF